MLPLLRSWPDELPLDPLVGEFQSRLDEPDDPDDDPELPMPELPLDKLELPLDEPVLPMLPPLVDPMLPLFELRSRPCWSRLLLP